MRPFDADAYLAALEPPAFTVGSRTFTGRVLSVFEQAVFDVRFAQLDQGQLSPPATAALIRAYLEALFPAPPPPRDTRTRWQRWAWACTRWLGSPPPPAPLHPVDVFLALPVAAQLQAFADFARSRQTMAPLPGAAADAMGPLRPGPSRSVS